MHARTRSSGHLAMHARTRSHAYLWPPFSQGYLLSPSLDFRYINQEANRETAMTRMTLHRDRNNRGESLIIALGNYSGGGLWVAGSGEFDIHDKFMKFDGNIPHGPLPSKGERYSIVLYTNSKMETASRDDLEVPCRFGLCTASLSMLCIHSKPPVTLACSKHASSAFRSPSHPRSPCGTCRASHSFLCFGTQQHGQTSQLSAAGFHHCQNLKAIPIPSANTQIRIKMARPTRRVRTMRLSCPRWKQ